MTKEEFAGINIEDIIANHETLEIVQVMSAYSDSTKPFDELYLSLSGRRLDNGHDISINKIDHEKWNYITDTSPDKIQLIFLKYRMANLESFVYSRLR